MSTCDKEDMPTITASRMAKHWLTLRRLILIATVLIVCKLSWDTFHAVLSEPSPLDVAGLPVNPDFDKIFKPKSCIMTANGSCIEEKPDDAYMGKGLYAHGEHFYLDGRVFRILSGSFHYFRTQPTQWGDRLLKMRAAGLNTVMTYIPWNLHEPIKGQYMFTGKWDIASFVRQAQKVGLKVIVRPGPYICAEWEWGGLPAWLLKDPNMVVRTSYASYLKHVDQYFSKLFPILAPLAYKKGGPVIAFQIENEYGSYGADKAYLQFLLDQFKKWRIEELLFTSDGTRPHNLHNGTIPGILGTANFKENQIDHLTKLKAFQPNKPLMVTEFWSGWFDHWEEPKHHTMDPQSFRDFTTNILKYGASINFYMFVGGTNFEFWNGANFKNGLYYPTVTSYDYDCPISEDGSLTEKYHITRELIKTLVGGNEELPEIPKSDSKARYGVVTIEDYLPYKTFSNILEDASLGKYGDRIQLKHPVVMEALDLVNGCGQNVGFLLYRASVKPSNQSRVVHIHGTLEDRGQVLESGRELGVIYRNKKLEKPLVLPPTEPSRDHVTLDILVENMGRVNFQRLNPERKGILGNITLGEEVISGWKHLPLDFDEEFHDTIIQQDVWMKFVPEDWSSGKHIGPTIFRTHLNLDTYPKDTFLDMKGWSKGIVLVNGYNIGRYWREGPQQTLYIPQPLLLHGKNTIVIFELHQPHSSITFVDKPILEGKW